MQLPREVRTAADGTYFTPNRKIPHVEEFMDKHFFRVAGENRWLPKSSIKKPLEELRQYFDNKIVFIVGKGASLDFLTVEHFPIKDAPVIAINEAIRKVEQLDLPNSLFVVQQDARLGETCLPKKGIMIASWNASRRFIDKTNVYQYMPSQFGLSSGSLSVEIAIEIAKMLGAKSFVLISFDASVNGDTRYADCIGYASTRHGNPNRFLKHGYKILSRIKNDDISWIIPKDPAEQVSSTLELQQDNLVEHHEHDHE